MKTDMNKEQLKELLLKAKGEHSQAGYARICGMDRYYLNKLIQGAAVPTQSALRKIAEHSEDRVTLNELLKAAGLKEMLLPPEKAMLEELEKKYGPIMTYRVLEQTEDRLLMTVIPKPAKSCKETTIILTELLAEKKGMKIHTCYKKSLGFALRGEKLQKLLEVIADIYEI